MASKIYKESVRLVPFEDSELSLIQRFHIEIRHSSRSIGTMIGIQNEQSTDWTANGSGISVAKNGQDSTLRAFLEEYNNLS